MLRWFLIIYNHYFKSGSFFNIFDLLGYIFFIRLVHLGFVQNYALFQSFRPNQCVTLQSKMDELISEPVLSCGGCYFTTTKHTSYKTFIMVGLLLGTAVIRLVKSLRWHPGASVFTKALYFAFRPLFDVFFVIALLALGFGAFLQILMGGSAGRKEFTTLSGSVIAVFRIAFGHFDYNPNFHLKETYLPYSTL